MSSPGENEKKQPEQRGTKWPMPTEVLKKENLELRRKLGDMERRYEELQQEYARFREVAEGTVDAGVVYAQEVERLEKVVAERDTTIAKLEIELSRRPDRVDDNGTEQEED